MRTKIVTFTVPSEKTAWLLGRFPRFRGYAALVSWCFRFLPFAASAIMQVKEKRFYLDLRYRSHVTSIVQGAVEPGETSFFVDHLASGDVFFDIGSNWGYYSALGSALVGEPGLVVAVEANPEPYTRLVNLINISAVTNVLPFNTALSDVSGELVTINKPWYRQDTGGFVSPSDHLSMQGVVTTRTLDHLWRQLGEPSVRAVKIDVEGFEPRVIRGGRAFLSGGVRDFALVEVTEWTLKRCALHYSTIYNDLRECGFAYTYIFANGGSLVPFQASDHTPLPVQCNVLFSKQALGIANEVSRA